MAEDVKPAGTPPETYDDRPIHSEAPLPPEVQAPLAEYKGELPPSPQWFKDAIAQEPERIFVESLGSKLEVLVWGEVGKPGLLFAHGNRAHAGGWGVIAPFVAALLAPSRLTPRQPARDPSGPALMARRSLSRVPLEDGVGEGWTWRFDPNMWTTLERSRMMLSGGGTMPAITTPLVHIYGANS